MFENVLGQGAVIQLTEDIKAGTLAPSLLFSGPPSSGKGTAALELGRILSCEHPGVSGVYAPWNCSCRACSYHRNLSHPDLLILGSRPFSAEIAAAAAAFLREREAPAVRMLFIRSVRKLLARFSPVLWEEDPKIGRLSSLLVSLEEDLDELGGSGLSPEGSVKDGDARKKLCDSIMKNALKLEAEGMGELIPIAQIRRAAYWSRLAPLGKRKLLLIENADRMQEGGRNSLLKILEEPPASVNILLTTAREESLLPTILSRLRPYRFRARDGATEAEVIRRVFRDSGEAEKGAEPKTREGEGRITAYLDSFLPISGETLYPLAALLAASLALAAVMRLKRARIAPPPGLIALGKYTVPMAEAADLGRPPENTALAAAKVLKGAGGFEVRSRFSRFLQILLTLARKSFRDAGPGGIVLMDIWRRHIREAELAVGTYNQNPALALDRLCSVIPGDMAGAFSREYIG